MKNNFSPPAMASAGAAGAFVVILVWILGTFHIQVPDTVGSAFVVLVTFVVHYLTSIHLIPSPDSTAATEATDEKKETPNAAS